MKIKQTRKSLAVALDSEFVFTSVGTKAIYRDTLAVAGQGISAAMKKAKETRAPFMLSDVRRTAETMLPAMGISQDGRVQIQSHGLGDV